MAATRGELKKILQLAKDAFPENGAGKRFLKTSWDGMVAAHICHEPVDGVCPMKLIHQDPDGVKKITDYLEERIARKDNPSAHPYLI